MPFAARSMYRWIAACAVMFGAVAALRCAPAFAAETKKAVPARTAVLARSPGETNVPARQVDWSGYRGIRRYSPYYYPGYAAYSPYYYGNYAYRPWYARPYAYAYGYPGYAGPFYRAGYPRFAYPGYAYPGFRYPGFAGIGYPAYAPYAWGGFYPPPIAAPVVVGPAIVGPQVSSTGSADAADYVGCYYW
jgi:hypothetical protein